MFSSSLLNFSLHENDFCNLKKKMRFTLNDFFRLNNILALRRVIEVVDVAADVVAVVVVAVLVIEADVAAVPHEVRDDRQNKMRKLKN